MFLSRTTYMRVLNGLQPLNCYNYFIYETTIPQLRWTEACELVTNVDRTIIVVKKSKTCYTMCFVSFVPIQKPSATISRCNIIVIILVWPTSWTPALGSLIVCVCEWVSVSADISPYCSVHDEPPLAWSSTPVSTKSSCTRHLHLQPEGSGMVETMWCPSHAMEWRPRQRFKTAGDNIDGGFQHRPRPFPLEVNHCCSCRLHALVARALVKWSDDEPPSYNHKWLFGVYNRTRRTCQRADLRKALKSSYDEWLIMKLWFMSFAYAGWSDTLIIYYTS